MTRSGVLAGLTLAVLATNSIAWALNPSTHELVNRAAALSSGLDATLKDVVGLRKGISDPLLGVPGLRWVELGGSREDDGRLLDLALGKARYLRHFHDPLQPWDRAGLRLGPFRFDASVRWMQRPDQASVAVGGSWAWPDARRHYRQALTSTDPVVREQRLADTLRALGQLMHLVVDASVPEHTRNDIHPLGGVFGNYEYWVASQHGERGSEEERAFVAQYLAQPLRPDPVLLRQPTEDPGAPVPVARLLDTDTYRGTATGPNVTLGPAIGLAEVANANFFSEDTDEAPSPYPYPALSRLQRLTLPLPSGRIRAYFAKAPDDGLPVAPVLAECVLDEPAALMGLPIPTLTHCADEHVWRQVATHLLPRAVGYAAALLEYFFRGQLEIAPPEEFVYARAPYLPGNEGAFTTLRARVRNASTLAGQPEPLGPGTLTAVVRYRTLGLPGFPPLDPFTFPTFPLSLTEHVVRSQPVPVGPGTAAGPLTDAFRTFTFDFAAMPLPARAVDVRLQVIYEGPVGLEADSVAVGFRDLLEPDPVDYVNATDWECFQGTLYPVADFTLFPPYPPDGYEPARDRNGDGVVDLLGPALERGMRLKVADPTLPPPVPSATLFDLTVPEADARLGAQLGRVVILQDQPWYGVAFRSEQLVDAPTGLTRPGRGGAFLFRGVVNDLVLDAQGRLVHRVTLNGVYRGSPGFHRILLVSSATVPCLGATATLEPPLSLIPSPPAVVAGFP